MSYCRFIEGDVYLFASVTGHFECCACRLAPLVKTIFTTGIAKGEPGSRLFGPCGPCPKCQGSGCPACMMHGSTTLDSVAACLEHLVAHAQAGHHVPRRAFERLLEESASEPVPVPDETLRAARDALAALPVGTDSVDWADLPDAPASLLGSRRPDRDPGR